MTPPHPEIQDTAQNGDAASPDSGCELAGLHGYYAALIAAARATLSPANAAAVARALQNEKIIAVRSAKNRRHAARANLRKLRQPIPAPGAAPFAKKQLG